MKIVAVLVMAMVAGAIVANAQTCEPYDGTKSGRWIINNHPDGSAAPPTYCLRLDGFGSKSESASVEYLFDCNQLADTKPLVLSYDANTKTAVIEGTVVGGKEVNNAVSTTDEYRVRVELSVYTENTSGGNTVISLNSANTAGGYILGPIGANQQLVDLVPKKKSDWAFRFAVGHRCKNHAACQSRSPQYEGWGWVWHHKSENWNYKSASDFLFIIGDCAPEDPVDPTTEDCFCDGYTVTTACLDDGEEHFEDFTGACGCVEWIEGSTCTRVPTQIQVPCDA